MFFNLALTFYLQAIFIYYYYIILYYCFAYYTIASQRKARKKGEKLGEKCKKL